MVHGDEEHQVAVVDLVAAVEAVAAGSHHAVEDVGALVATGGGVEDAAEASQEAVGVVVATVGSADGAEVHRLYADSAALCCRIVYHFLRDFRSFSTAIARSFRSRPFSTTCVVVSTTSQNWQ